MKQIIRYALLLFLVSSISTILVIGAVSYAEPILEKRESNSVTQALEILYDDINDYQDITENYDLSDYEVIKGIYVVKLSNNKTHHVYKVSSAGKNGDISYIISINEKGEILDIEYITMNETPGRGDKVTLPDFTNQIIGDSKQVQADTITGATISSKSVINSANKVLEHYEKEVK